MTVEEIRTLYEYNCWANDQVLAAASQVDDAAFAAADAVSHGSLRGILVHTLAVEWLWRQRCHKGTSPPQYIPGESFHQVESVRVAWLEEARAMRRYLDHLTDAGLNDTVCYATRRGENCDRVLWQLLVHLVNHGTQHRAEAGTCLARLGHGPGDLDFVLWLGRGRPAGLGSDVA
ncbi:MAG: DinB family protein [Deferrisomatales bacterium]|nr:DinB family protein [Deferrisomatales bacterium]